MFYKSILRCSVLWETSLAILFKITVLHIQYFSYFNILHFQFSSVQSLSRVWLFVTPWIAARQASLSITT